MREFKITSYEQHVMSGLCKQYARKLRKEATNPNAKPTVIRATKIEAERWEKISRGVFVSNRITVK